MDVPLILNRLVPIPLYRGGLENNETSYNNIIWDDSRDKPTWQALEAENVIYLLEKLRTDTYTNCLSSYKDKLNEGYQYTSTNLTIKVDCDEYSISLFAEEVLRLKTLTDYTTTEIRDFDNVTHKAVPRQDYFDMCAELSTYFARLRAKYWYYKDYIKTATEQELKDIVFDWTLPV